MSTNDNRKVTIIPVTFISCLLIVLCVFAGCSLYHDESKSVDGQAEYGTSAETDTTSLEITETATTIQSETQPVTTECVETEAPTVQPETSVPVGPAEYSDEVKKAIQEGRKVVYLTFDDGPWEKTDELLDVLKRYDVKATFFVNGYSWYEDKYRRIYAEGHTLGMHTYSHKYDVVYSDMESFKMELNSISDYIEEITGNRPYLFRFPGGSSTSMTENISVYINYINKQNIVYFDWNVDSRDAVGEVLPAEQIYHNVITGIEREDVSVVLMHDLKGRETTIEAVTLILEKLQAINALILPITKETVPVHHNIR